MIKITNGTNAFKIDNKYLQKIEDGYLIKSEYDYFMINLIIVIADDKITKIIKTLPFGERILDCFPNLSNSNNEIILAEEDYNRFKKLYNNLHNKVDIRKQVLINSVSEILAYEYYQARFLEDNSDTTLEYLFDYEIPIIYNSKEYRDEILNKARIILKKYNK